MAKLITAKQLAYHLREDEEEAWNRLEEVIAEASAIVMNYLKMDVPTAWMTTETESPTGTGVPYDVQAAVKLVAGELYKNREGSSDPLSKTVKSLLHRRRDPAIA